MYLQTILKYNGLFPPSGKVQYSTQLFPFPFSEVVNGPKITNHTIRLFWDPSVEVSSTVVRYLKGKTRLTAEH